MTKQQLIEDNMGLVYAVIKEHFPTFMYDEDLIQVGMIGLCQAANTFDEAKGKFSTFAGRCIYNEICKEFRRRQKHQGVYSLDYEYDLDDGERVTVGDIQVGDEDVDFVDTDYIYRHLTPEEQNIVDLVRYGLTYREVGEVCGVSRSYVWRVIRKVRNIMEVHNGNN